MIGIPMLDSLFTEALIQISKGDREIRIPIYPELQLSIDRRRKPKPQTPIKIMDNQKVITLCKMEIESRLGWQFLSERLQENRT